MKIKLPKEMRKALGVKKKYVDVEDVFELLWKVVKRWLQGSVKKKRPSFTKSKPITQSRSQPQMVARSSANGNVAMKQSTMQTQLDQAVQYQQEIRQMGETAVSDFDKMRVDRLIVLVDDWVETVHDLAQRIDNFQQNELIHRDLKAVPKAIADLEKRMAKTENPLVREELERTQANRQRQLTSLEKLRDTMEWAEMRVESTVSMLGTIYSKLLISRSQGQVADYGRLLAEANEEVDALHDYLDALQEVKAIG
jgi:hypothetical protein